MGRKGIACPLSRAHCRRSFPHESAWMMPPLQGSPRGFQGPASGVPASIDPVSGASDSEGSVSSGLSVPLSGDGLASSSTKTV
jgi:hypothetical protein